MIRDYPYSDAELLKLASKFKAAINEHYELLESAVTGFDPSFRENYNRAYSEARNLIDESNEQERLKKLRESIENEIKTAISLFSSFRLYIQRAFPHDSRMWDKFDYCNFEKAMHDLNKMLNCFDEFHEIIRERKRELDSVHCPPYLYHDIEVVRELLHNMVDENERLEKELSHQNEMRLNKFNELYFLISTARDSAENVFKDDPETLKLFVLPVPKNVKQNVR